MTVRDHIDAGRPAEAAPLRLTFTAMATSITLQVIDPGPAASAALEAARAVFSRVEAACTRFDPQSPLMRANHDGLEWHSVPPECYLAVDEATRAHRETDGLFDPRVLDTLIALGYDRTLPFNQGLVDLASPAATDPADPGPCAPAPLLGPWEPGLEPTRSAIRLGPRGIDLGGIGKGLAVRLAGLELAAAGRAYLVEAGGDCLLGGDGPVGGGWRVGVEDPFGGPEPLAVLQLSDTGCATSSLRVRTWQLNGTEVHHLIDPRTGRSAAGGVRAVTVVHPDPAWAEVWSKALLITGRKRIRHLAETRGLAAAWVDDDSRVEYTAPMADFVIWPVPDAR